MLIFPLYQFEHIVNTVAFKTIRMYAAFLVHVGKQQLLRQMSMYIEKKHYHVGKKFANVWQRDTLFQSNDISVGESLSCRKYC